MDGQIIAEISLYSTYTLPLRLVSQFAGPDGYREERPEEK
jgi:hypothetical protein